MTRQTIRPSSKPRSGSAFGRLRNHLLATVAAGAVATFGLTDRAMANPTGPAAQGATVTGAGTPATTVTLGGSRAIINWNSFDIGAGDTTTFLFNSNSGIALNRVNNGSATIDGKLFGCVGASCTGSNFGGNIWIYARDGVLIGNGAVIDTGGFLATTSPLAMTDSAFMNGDGSSANQFDFGAANPNSSVQVLGDANITGHGGTLAFIAPQVTTASGTKITAPGGNNGSVLYGATSSYRVKFAEDATTGDLDLVNFDVPAGQAGGTASTTPIAIAGATKAGNIYLAAVTKSSVADAMISISGTQVATQASATSGGDIVLSAGGGISNGAAVAPSGGASGAVSASVSGTQQADREIALNATGNLNVSGTMRAGVAGQAGGTIVATANNAVDIAGSANISANGTSGGAILIGGNIHGGAHPSQNFAGQTVTDAQTTTIEKGALISATGSTGVGGDVVIWSNSKTNFNGLIDANGATAGGFAEVSSHQFLSFTGLVDLRSSNGKAGNLLIDPEDVYICAPGGCTTNATFAGGTYTANGDNSTISTTDLENELGLANVTVTTGGAGSPGSQNGDIYVQAPVSWTSQYSLTLDAYHSIFVQAALSGSEVDMTANNGGSGGVIEFDSGGSVSTTTAYGGTGNQTYNSPVSLTADITLTSTNGLVDFASTVDGAQTLTVSGNAEFDGNVGGTTPLSSLSVSGTTLVTNGITVATSGNQAYTGAVTLGSTGSAATYTFGSTGGLVNFQSTVDDDTLAADNLEALAVTGNAAFGGNVGGNEALASTSVSGTTALTNGITVTTTNAGGGSGDQTYTGAVTLGSTGSATTYTFSSTGGLVNFQSTVDDDTLAADNLESLAVTGNAEFDGDVGGSEALASLSVSGTTELHGGTVSTTNGQSYQDAVTLGGDITLTDTSANGVTFISTVDGAHNLTVSATSGQIEFGNDIGTGTPLTSLTAEGNFVDVGGNVTTTGNIFLQANGASGIEFEGGTIQSTSTGLISLQADALTFDGALTFGNGSGTLEYAPYTQGTSVSIGDDPSDILSTSGIVFDITNLRIGAVTVPGTGLTTTAGAIDVADDYFLGSINLELDATTTGGGTGAITESGGGIITTGTLTGTAASADLTNTDNAIADLGTFTTTGDFSLTNSQTLDVTGSVVAGSGNTTGNLTLTTTSGDIDLDGSLTAASGNSQIVTLVSAGGITQNSGIITADELTGNSQTGTSLTGNNLVTTLEAFQVEGGDFSLTNNQALQVDALDVSSLGIGEGVSAGYNTGTGNLTLTTLTGGLTLNGDLHASSESTQTVTLISAAGISQTGGIISADYLTGSSVNDTSLTDANHVLEALDSFTVSTSGGFALDNYFPLVVSGNISAPGNIFLESADPSGITFNAAAPPLEIVSTGNGFVSFQADALDFQTVTVVQGGTLEYAPYTAGNTVTVGTGGALQSSNFEPDVSLIRVGAVTEPGASSITTTAGEIDVTDPFNFGSVGLEFDATVANASTGGVNINNALSAGSLLVNAAGTITIGTNTITTTGTQEYNGAVSLATGGTDTLSASTVTFDSTVDGADTLAITGNAVFDGVVGGSTQLAALTVSGTTGVDTSAISTTGGQTYSGAVTLEHDPTFTGTLVDFGSTLDGGYPLIVDGNAEFDGDVGDTTPLASIDVTGATYLNASSIATTNAGGGTGNQTYEGAVTLGQSVNLTSTGGLVDFQSTVDDTTLAGSESLTVTGNAEFDGAVGFNVALESVTVTGTTALNGPGVTTVADGGSGDQIYEGAATLEANNTLTTSGLGFVDFGSTLDDATAGAHTLTVAGNAEFDGNVGGSKALGALTADDTTLFTNGITVTTSNADSQSGNQTYTGEVTLGSDAALTSYTFQSTGGTVDFQGGVDGTIAGEESLAVTGNAEFDTDVGDSVALGSLSVSGSTVLTDAVTMTTTNTDGDTGNQTYTGAVTLGSNGNDTYTFASTGGTVDFGSTVDGTYSGEEVLNVDGNAEFDGAVGGTTALGSLSVTGTTLFDGGSVTTTDVNAHSTALSGNQTYTGAVTLNQSTTLTSTGGLVDFQSTVDDNATAGAQNLAVNGNAEFDGNVGFTTALGSIDVTGTTLFTNGIEVVTTDADAASGNQTYTGAVTLGSTGTLTLYLFEIQGGRVDFGSTVDGTVAGEEELAVFGNAEFDGNVGGNEALGDLGVFFGSTRLANGITLTTSDIDGDFGDQDFLGPVKLGSSGGLTTYTFNSTGGTVDFAASVNGTVPAEEELVVNGNAEFDGNVGFAVPLGSIDVTGTTLFTDGIEVITESGNGTSGNQTYTGAVTLGSTGGITTYLFANEGGTLDFRSTVDGTVAGEEGFVDYGNAEFDGNVGGNEALSFLYIDGSTLLTNGITVTTSDIDGGSGNQFYGGPVTLGSGGALTTYTFDNVGLGTVDFQSTLDGSVAGEEKLAVGGNAEFDGNVGSNEALGSISVSGTTLLTNAATVSTSNSDGASGNQTYTGAVTLGSDGAITPYTFTSAGGLVDFQSTVDGTVAGEEELAVGGNAEFDGNVGGGVTLGSVSVSGTTHLTDAVSVTTTDIDGDTGNQTYTGHVLLASGSSDTYTFNSTGGLVDFGGGTDGSVAGQEVLDVNGNAEFGGAIGSSVALGSITVEGTTDLNGGAVVTTGTDGHSGDQTYAGAATLGAGTTLSGTTVAFFSTLNGDYALHIAGNAEFGGAVGGTTPLASVSVSGTTALIGRYVATSGTQTYEGAVTLDAGTVLTASSVDFGSTLDGGYILAVIGNAEFGGAVGGGTPLMSLGVSGTTALDGGSVTTTGQQTYSGAATLGAGTTLTASLVDFGATLDGAHTLGVTGDAEFDGPVGGVTPLTSISVSAITALDGGAVTTSGTQTYTGATTLGANTILTAPSVDFGSTLNGTTTGAQSLTVDGDVAFNGVVGNTQPLLSLTVTGTTAIDNPEITTVDNQNFEGAVTLDLSTRLMSTGGLVDFGSTLNGAFGLTVTGNVEFDGAVGGATPLASVSVSGTTALDGGSTATSGTQTYTGASTLGADTTLTASSVDFGSTLDGGYMLGISGNAEFDGAVGGATPLASIDVSGTTAVNTGAISTSGDQTYSGAVTLEHDPAFTGTLVDFGSTLDGNYPLIVVGNAEFDGVVGSLTALASVSVSGTSAIDGGAITTNGAQTYTGAVTLGANTALTSNNGGPIEFGSTLDGAYNLFAIGNAVFDGEVGQNAPLRILAVTGTADIDTDKITTTVAQDYEGPVTLSSASTLTNTGSFGFIDFDSTVDGDFALTLNAMNGSAYVIFFGPFGSNAPLASLTINATQADLGGSSITTVGVQVYDAPVQLGSNNQLTGSTIIFDSTLDGRNALGITGNAVFDGAVSGSGPFAGPLVSLTISGTTAIDGGAVTTTGAQTYMGGVTLGNASWLTSTGGGAIAFDSTVNGPGALTTNSGGLTTFEGAVGGTTALASVTVDGTSAIDGGSVKTSGPQIYSGATTLGAGTTLSGTTIDFGSTLDGGYMLGITGNAEFDGAVGGATPLASIDVSGTTAVNTGAISTSGDQTYSGAVTLEHDPTFTGTLVDFGSTLDGNYPLIVVGNAEFDGVVGSLTALASVSVSGTSAIDGGAITTNGAQTYTGAAMLGADTTLTSNNGDLIEFGSTLDGGHALTVTGNAEFGGEVGGTTPLTSIAITGSTDLDGQSVSTTGDQTYEGAVTVATDNTLTSTGGLVDFATTVDGAHALTVDGNAAFDGAVGGTTPLTGLTTDGGSLVLTADVTTTGNQSYTVTGSGNTLDVPLGVAIDSTGGNVSLTTTNPAADIMIEGTVSAATGTVTLTSAAGIDAGSGVIDAGTLTGSSGRAATLSDTSNAVGTLNGFANTSGAFLFTDSVPLTITGTLNASGQTVTLTDTGGGITAGAGVIDAGTLTGSANGNVLFTDAANAINTLNGFTNTAGAFSLADSVPLTVIGTLNASGQTVTITDTGGGIDAHAGVIEVNTLTGSANGNVLFTDASNTVNTLNGFANTAGNFALTDSVALTITGTLDPAPANTITLVDTGGGIDSSNGIIVGGTLTGSTAGNAIFTDASNDIVTLGSFTNASGFFSLTDSVALTISGTLNATGQAVSLADTGGGVAAGAGVIDAATLTGSTTGAAIFTDASNVIGTLGNFTNVAGAFSLTDSTPLTMTGALNATGQTVTLTDTGGGIAAGAGAIDAATLTGTTYGTATFTDASNAIDTLGSFTNTSGAFSLADSVAMGITGTLNAAGQSVALTDTGGGIDAHAGVIDAATLTGSANGNVLFTDASNAIDTLGGFTNTAGNFALTDSVALTITGTLDPAPTNTITLVDTGGGIDSSNGIIEAGTLTGSTAGDAVFTDASNDIVTLGSFTNTSGAFSLSDSVALTISGTLNATGHAVTLADSGGGIAAGAGVIEASMLTGSTTGAATFTDAANDIVTLGNFTNSSGAFALTDSTALSINGTLDAAGQSVTLVDTGGGIAAASGAIEAATLAGSTAGAATFTDASNVIGTLGSFTNTFGAFSLTDSTALTINGTLNATGQAVTLVSTGGGINAGSGIIDADSLSGASTGAANFANASNTIGTLAGFANASGAFSLTDSVPLTITGTLDAAGQAVMLVDTGGGIAAGSGVIKAATLTGSSTGATNFTDAANAIGTLTGFTDMSGSFALTDATPLAIAGTLNATGQTVTLVDTGGSIDAGAGVVDAAALTGAVSGNATFTGNNAIGVLDAFRAAGSFSLTDTAALNVDGADVSALGFTGVSADQTGGGGNLTIVVTGAGNGLTLAGNLTAGTTGGADTVSLAAPGDITQSSGTIIAAKVDASSGAGIVLNGGTIDANTMALTGAENVTEAGSTVDATNVTLSAEAGNVIDTGGVIEGTTVTLNAGNNILIGEPEFITAAENFAGTIRQAVDPLLPIVLGPGGGFYEAQANDHGVDYQNYIFIETATLNLTAPNLIVSENTGTLPTIAGSYNPMGIAITQSSPPPNAILIDGGATGSSVRPSDVDLFVTLVQGGASIGPLEIADSAQIAFGPDTSKNNAYEINGCVIHNLGSCTVAGFAIVVIDPNKQAELQIVVPDDQSNDELDLTTSGEGNDEIWEDESWCVPGDPAKPCPPLGMNIVPSDNHKQAGLAPRPAQREGAAAGVGNDAILEDEE